MTRKSLVLTVALLVAVGSAVAVQAQPRPTPLSAALEDLAIGRTIRIHTLEGRLLEGRYAGVSEDRLVMHGEAGLEQFAVTEIVALWEKGRATGKGAAVGAWTAGLAFAVYGGLLEMAFANDTSFPLGGIVVGGSLGAVSGGVTGGLVGAAIPKWHQRWGMTFDRRDLPPAQKLGEPPVEPGDPSLGLASFGFGMVDPDSDDDERGILVSGALTSSLGSRFRHGLDLSLAENIGARPAATYPDPPPFVRGQGETMWSAGWRLEWMMARPHASAWDPYLVVGAGAYGWVETYLGVNYGLGLTWRDPGGSSGVFLEIRRHDNIQNLMETDPAYVTGVLGVSSSW